MSTNRYYRSTDRNTYSYSSHHMDFSSYSYPTSSTHTPIQHHQSYHHVTPSRDSLLRLPNFSEVSSHIAYSREGDIHHQPHANPLARFLNRSIETCPAHLTDGQTTKWLKMGEKARNNHHIVSSTIPFHCSELVYDSPIHIHHQTPIDVLQGVFQKIAGVRLYALDTELDKPTKQHPHSVPALIQIQAIHSQNLATIFLVETQHLPGSSTTLFRMIQKLLQRIFSVENTFIAWGDVTKELRPFAQFNLFDMSHIINTFNIQEAFTNQWNIEHPHIPECLTRHQLEHDINQSDDYLICFINTDDLEEEIDLNNIQSNYSTCICPDTIRPYKTKNDMWSLQKAIFHSLHQALDKSMTLNIWSCGLDITLNNCHNTQDQLTRNTLVTYAINDILAPTHLFFHLTKSIPSHITTTTTSILNSIMNFPVIPLPSFLLITDSHGKNLDPIITTSDYQLLTHAISGLHWIHHKTALCTRSLILQHPLSSLLSSCSGVLFLVGTNSVRSTSAPAIIEQITDIVDLIRFHHIHLRNKSDISIITTFPCFKHSSFFTSTSSLISNINLYNELLQTLARVHEFSFIDLNITAEHLHFDRMHVHHQYIKKISDGIIAYIQDVVNTKQQSTQPTRLKCRSREAIIKRNKKRHVKLQHQQKEHILTRPLHRDWQLQDIKKVLQYHHIAYSRILEIRKHNLRLQFHNSTRFESANTTLPLDIFNEHNLRNWLQEQDH